MAAPITPVTLANPSAAIIPPLLNPSGENQAAGSVFQTVFKTAVNTVEGFQTQANKSIQDFLSGNNEDIHSAVIATQRADLSFDLFMQVRNKVVSAYQEVMRMQV